MRIRLLVPTFINNHRYDRGDIVELPEGMRGPHRSVRKHHDIIDYHTDPTTPIHPIPEAEDVPLYEEIKRMCLSTKKSKRSAMSETETPKYLLTGPFWSAPPHVPGPGPHLHQNGDVIEFEGIPNANMQPVNEAARARVAIWRSGQQ